MQKATKKNLKLKFIPGIYKNKNKAVCIKNPFISTDAKEL